VTHPDRPTRHPLAWGCLDTPVGLLSVGCSPAGVARVRYGPPPAAAPAGDSPLLAAALAELADYFARRRTAFTVPVDLPAAPGARRAVLATLHASVGFGQTITYGALAARAGLTGGGAAAPGTVPPARLAGQIMAANPCPVIVPCHRVVAGGGLGGYSGGTGTGVKHWLLIFEGAFPATLDWNPAGLPAARRLGAAQAGPA
jgi:methylated-DNA-[protein]-cysteine S-methyltransferase